jgi:hypothetical protein
LQKQYLKGLPNEGPCFSNSQRITSGHALFYTQQRLADFEIPAFVKLIRDLVLRRDSNTISRMASEGCDLSIVGCHEELKVTSSQPHEADDLTLILSSTMQSEPIAGTRPPRSGLARSLTGGSSVDDNKPKSKAEMLGVKMPADPVRVARLNRTQAQVRPHTQH